MRNALPNDFHVSGGEHNYMTLANIKKEVSKRVHVCKDKITKLIDQVESSGITALQCLAICEERLKQLRSQIEQKEVQVTTASIPVKLKLLRITPAISSFQ